MYIVLYERTVTVETISYRTSSSDFATMNPYSLNLGGGTYEERSNHDITYVAMRQFTDHNKALQFAYKKKGVVLDAVVPTVTSSPSKKARS